jgi:serine/threonine-protein kinase Chk1
LSEDGIIKLADFALAKPKRGKHGSGIFYSRIGTEKYMAPELKAGRPYRADLCDVFSIGVVLFMMVT